jgi:WD40 repeat protein
MTTNISCEDQIFEIDFHPNQSFLVAGLITGKVELWNYDEDERKRLGNYSVFKQSCRGVEFNENGDELFAISSDCSWKILDSDGKVKLTQKNAHSQAINKLKVLNENLFVTGDDNGVVKLWDKRTPTKETMVWDAHSDYITDFDFYAENHTVFSAGGDATLCVYDIRKQENFYKSDDQESEIHCVKVMKSGKRVYCGTQEGPVVIFKWGDWGDCSDRYPGHTDGVECMAKLDEVTMITGSLDSKIRLFSLQPHRIDGIIGDHEGLTVEGMKVTPDQNYLATLSSDEIIRFWDISALVNDHEEENEEVEEDSSDGDDVKSGDEDKDSSDSVELQADADEDESDAEGNDEILELVDADSDDNVDEEDDDAEDAEAEDEEDEDDDAGNDNNSKNSQNDESDSDSDESEKPPKKKIKTVREQFYADL